MPWAATDRECLTFHASLVLMLMMRVRYVRVHMLKPIVSMQMIVRLTGGIVGTVPMTMVLLVHVGVGVNDRLM